VARSDLLATQLPINTCVFNVIVIIMCSNRSRYLEQSLARDARHFCCRDFRTTSKTAKVNSIISHNTLASRHYFISCFIVLNYLPVFTVYILSFFKILTLINVLILFKHYFYCWRRYTDLPRSIDLLIDHNKL